MYNALRENDDIINFGSFSHARRKFSEVVKISGNEQGLAAEMLERLKPLYILEARLKEIEAPHRIRKKLRKKRARPVLKKIHQWLLSILPQVPPKCKLGIAIRYTLTQWPYLVKYIHHGLAEIDTNFVENINRYISLGEKNWLFIGN